MSNVENAIQETMASVNRITVDDVAIQERKEKLVKYLTKVNNIECKSALDSHFDSFYRNMYPGVQSLLNDAIMDTRLHGDNLTPENRHNMTLACELLTIQFKNMLQIA